MVDVKNHSANAGFIKEFLSYGSFFYTLMVFMSFFQQHMFYNYFDIPIYYYTSTYELLFYFLPYFVISNVKVILKPYVIVCLVIFLVIYFRNKYYKSNWLTKLINFLFYSKNIFLNVIYFLVIVAGMFIWVDLISSSLNRNVYSKLEITAIDDLLGQKVITIGCSKFVY